jgi:hypothetical protein
MQKRWNAILMIESSFTQGGIAARADFSSRHGVNIAVSAKHVFLDTTITVYG